jgi:hypothetical protein
MFTEKRSKTMILPLLLVLVFSMFLTAARPAETFPELIPLPNGFQPEGIASGRGTTFYVGSIPTGAIYRGDYATGMGEILVPGAEGRQAIGLKHDRRTDLLFVAGGPTGKAFVYDADTGALVAEVVLTNEAARFVNDVVVTRTGAYFTDSFRPVLYRLPLEADGTLPANPVSEVVPLGGDFTFVPGGFNTNGITATPNGKALFIVNSTVGALYRVDPHSGEALLLDLGGGSVPSGDGILLVGKYLYVVQNFLNQIAVVRLNPSLDGGVVERTITSPHFRIPTTIAQFGNSLYAVNARFDTPPSPDTEYEVVRVPRR